MTAKLIPLETPRAAARADAVELLEDFLERAKAGEIIAVAIAAVRPDLNSETGYSETDNLNALLGSVSALDKRLAREVEF